MLTVELQVTDTLYEPDFTKSEASQQLNCSPKTVARYLKFGADFIPDLKKYVDANGDLIGMKILSSDLIYLEEIQDLKKTFNHSRVVSILTRKYTLEN